MPQLTNFVHVIVWGALRARGIAWLNCRNETHETAEESSRVLLRELLAEVPCVNCSTCKKLHRRSRSQHVDLDKMWPCFQMILGLTCSNSRCR